jgi:hypothetical protein
MAQRGYEQMQFLARPGYMSALVIGVFVFLASVRTGVAGTTSFPSQRNPGAWEPECWEVPAPATLVEAFRTWDAAARPGEAQNDNAMLAMSAGGLDSAYSAGLVAGWSETGKRPRFSVVTGVGVSALIAPFVFIGPSADGSIGDIFACNPTSLRDLAERAAARLDAEALAAITREHRMGRRLIIATPETQGHPSVIWDLGEIAGSGHPQARDYVRRILMASIDPSAFLGPRDIPIAAGAIAASEQSLGLVGSGRAFLVPASAGGSAESPKFKYYLINNGRIYPAESGSYLAAVRNRRPAELAPKDVNILGSAYSVLERASQRSENFLLASIDCKLNLVQAQDFDSAYLKALFLVGYRLGRTRQVWAPSLPGEAWAAAAARRR